MNLYSKRFLRNVLVTKRVPRSIKKLAKVANRAFSEPLEIGKLKDLSERHPRPANTDKIVVPKVWQSITSDLNILNIVASGYKIEFEKRPLKALVTKNKSFTSEKMQAIRKEVYILLHKGVIIKVPEFRIK